MNLFRFVICVCLCFCRYKMPVCYNLVVTCWGRADLLVFLYVMFSCVFCHFPIRCPGSGVILDCIDF